MLKNNTSVFLCNCGTNNPAGTQHYTVRDDLKYFLFVGKDMLNSTDSFYVSKSTVFFVVVFLKVVLFIVLHCLMFKNTFLNMLTICINLKILQQYSNVKLWQRVKQNVFILTQTQL